MKKSSGRVLVVDDDPQFLEIIVSELEEQSFHCVTALNREEMDRALETYSFDGILLDLMLGEEESLKAIPSVLRQQDFCCLIVMTANGSIPDAVDAMEKGATSFLSKTTGVRSIVSELKKRIKCQPKQNGDTYQGIIATSLAMQELISQVELVKDAEASVLLLGESGTGKELFARALHFASKRQDCVFESINCAAIPENLLEAELFGHEKGAFTGAHQSRKGMFELCHGGTLFLDEIGDRPLGLQAKLLRVLQEKEIRPLGATRTKKINTRVVAATHANLPERVEQKSFREDLYFRLAILPLKLPPLRERLEDIPKLLRAFVRHFRAFYSKDIVEPTPAQVAQLQTLDWPGNIRQLRNAVERAVLLSKDGTLCLRDLNPCDESSVTKEDSSLYKEARDQFEKIYLSKVMTLAKGNVSEAARISGRFRSDLYRQLEKFDVDPKAYRV